MKKNIIIAISLIICAVILTYLHGKYFLNNDNKGRVSFTRECFGTVFTISLDNLSKSEARKAIDECYSMCEDLETVFSSNDKNSGIYTINHSLNTPIEISSELFYIIKVGIEYNEITDGAFDLTLGSVISKWGIGTGKERIVPDEELKPYAGFEGSKYLILDDNRQTVTRTDERVIIDLGAIAKGYAANKVKAYIKEKYPDAIGILDFGGNIYAVGKKDGNSEWNIGITDPFNTAQMIGYVMVSDCSVVTSGNYERFFIADGVRYHHIMDPKTAKPANSGISCATIIGEDSMKCDILSTACYVLGKEKAFLLIENMDDVEAVIIDEKGRIYTSSGIDKYGFVKY